MSTLTLKRSELSEPEKLRATMRECAIELDKALGYRVGVMDSESKARAIDARRLEIMQEVAERLRQA